MFIYDSYNQISHKNGEFQWSITTPSEKPAVDEDLAVDE
jgi:hypothetical protein